jgi:hypothetical protein
MQPRDFTVRATLAKVQYHYDFAMIGVEKEEARRLVFIVEKFKDVAKKEYESETAHLHSGRESDSPVDTGEQFCPGRNYSKRRAESAKRRIKLYDRQALDIIVNKNNSFQNAVSQTRRLECK